MPTGLLRSLPSILAVVALILPGCINTQQLVTEKASALFGDVARSVARQSDVALVRQAIPSYLLLIDGMIQSYPDNPELLLAGARTYASYAALLEEDEKDRTDNLYAQAKQYAVRSLALHPLFKEAMGKPIDHFHKGLSQTEKRDVPMLFWVGSIWGSWIAATDGPEAMADLPWVEALIERVLMLDPSFHYGSPHLFKAILLSARPQQYGGNLQRADEHFKKAIEYGQGKFLMTYVYYAQYYAQQTLNKNLFESTLKRVLETPASVEPDLTLANTLAQRKAKALLAEIEEFF